jgi:hypothetical protein
MPSAGIESRRSERILLKVPIAVSCDGEEPVRAHTLVVNGHGALILVPRLLRADALLRVVNQETGQAALCRVACCCGEDLPGLFKIGIEILGMAAHFWGPPYESAFASDASTPRPS